MKLKTKERRIKEGLQDVGFLVNKEISVSLNNRSEDENAFIMRRKTQMLSHAVMDSIINWVAEWDLSSIKNSEIAKAVTMMVFPVFEELPLCFAWFAGDWAMTEIMSAANAEDAMRKAEEFFGKDEMYIYKLIEEHVRRFI